MKDPRPSFPSGYEQATPEEIKAVYDGYFAYFGTYTVDEDEGIVTHHVQSSKRPSYVGTHQKRLFEMMSRSRFGFVVCSNAKLSQRRGSPHAL